jgi:hypothetical protein
VEKQPLEVQTLYAELLERLVDYEAHRAIGHVAGSFVTKTIKGGQYYYFQYLEPGGDKRQVYLGRKDDALDRVVERHARARSETSDDEESIQRLCAILRAGGIMSTDTATARVLRALADAGVFKLGGVLIGTHAFVVIGNTLGVRWTGASLRTQDVDVAAVSTMSVVIPGASADVPAALESLEMGFLPVPGLDPVHPSTSYKVRGQGLRVDLLTPARGRPTGPVNLRRLNAAAQPLKFLDLVTESTMRDVRQRPRSGTVRVPQADRRRGTARGDACQARQGSCAGRPSTRGAGRGTARGRGSSMGVHRFARWRMDASCSQWSRRNGALRTRDDGPRPRCDGPLILGGGTMAGESAHPRATDPGPWPAERAV